MNNRNYKRKYLILAIFTVIVVFSSSPAQSQQYVGGEDYDYNPNDIGALNGRDDQMDTSQMVSGKLAQGDNAMSDLLAESGKTDSTDGIFSKIYGKLDFKKTMNWGDCFDWSQTVTVAMCPGTPPYPSPKFTFKYWDPVALVEVVPDPWRSYLYNESFYDFSGQASAGPLEVIIPGSNIKPAIGSGYKGKKGNKDAQGKENSGEERENMHVWSVSDFWRFKTSAGFMDACKSLTCKLKDKYYCRKLLTSSFQMSQSVLNTIKSLNQNQKVDGKGQGVKQGDKVLYDDGSVYQKNKQTGKYEQIRGPGNYGAGGAFKNADTLGNSADILGTAASVGRLGVTLASKSSSNSAKVLGIVTTGSNLSVPSGFFKDENQGKDSNGNMKIVQDTKDNSTALPPSTMVGGKKNVEPSALSNKDASISDMANNGNDYNNAGNKQASSAFSGLLGNAKSGGLGSSAFDNAIMIADQVSFFSPVEMLIRGIASRVPFSIHPIFMSERFEKASGDGGMLMAPLFQQLGDMGAGLIMPVFCFGKIAGMAVDGVLNLVGVDIPSNMLGPISSFINGRCVGSWGPLEPRVNMIGTGDTAVAAGLASVRGLHIANNLSLFGATKVINSRPHNDLHFNLDWPHQSDCKGFTGFDGLSRGWTSPLGSTFDNVSDAVKSGDFEQIKKSVKYATVGEIKKQGGYVFTYWKHRKCSVIWLCDKWSGDTGL